MNPYMPDTAPFSASVPMDEFMPDVERWWFNSDEGENGGWNEYAE